MTPLYPCSCMSANCPDIPRLSSYSDEKSNDGARRLHQSPALQKAERSTQGGVGASARSRKPAEWPSGLRRCVKAAVRKGVGSNPTSVSFFSHGLSASPCLFPYMGPKQHPVYCVPG
ncbi:hypothetical protein BESB_022180 [Besnoitia besnoiti]|uniref:Uncharacterized protein n=1 Tax=Besnoitia besnoiti TaxID=94643 RepID=A0A2A9M754_BESBE|nr:hypothetical protein BESB_022180 [Besnoitia besnoiti]PFH31726.1 hypothetical protein BESB_022180 [Besnoitia besnoiti]